MSSSDASSTAAQAEAEVVGLCQDLIRIESINYGDGSGPGERATAEYVAASLSEVGLSTEIIESDPGRASVVTRIKGADSSRGGAADPRPPRRRPGCSRTSGRHPPFAAEIAEDCVWGRGAVDMKDMDAMILALVRSGPAPAGSPRATSCWPSSPTRRPVVPRARATSSTTTRTLFEGCTEAISEVGGFSITVAAQRALRDRDRAEGHGLDAADRARPRRARVDDRRGQRRHRAVRGGRPHRRPPLPGPHHQDRAGVPGRDLRGPRRAAGPGRPRRPGGSARHRWRG